MLSKLVGIVNSNISLCFKDLPRYNRRVSPLSSQRRIRIEVAITTSENFWRLYSKYPILSYDHSPHPLTGRPDPPYLLRAHRQAQFRRGPGDRRRSPGDAPGLAVSVRQ